MMMTRIMVVDDDPLIRQLLMYQLGGAGYEVCVAQNGQDALQRLLLEHPDLVLLDVVMPDMSGWHVCRAIRAWSTVPIIMLTAKSAESDIISGLESGADDYISKPFSLPQLLARVEAVLRRTRPESPASAAYAGSRERTRVLHPRTPPAKCPAQPAPQTHRYHGPLTEAVAPASPPFPGQKLAEARKMRGMTLHQAEAACGIRWDFLQALERGYAGYIPHAQRRKVFKRYSEFLGIDPPATTERPPPLSPASSHWSVYLVVGASVVLLVAMTFNLIAPF
jgi:CheY-like chemotaxis protein